MEQELVIAAIAFAFGGILKGAIGAGTPVVVVPILAIFQGVPFAVAIFTFPNLLSNIWQAWSFRAHRLDARFLLFLGLGAALGALFGSVVLAFVPARVLMAVVASLTFIYVGFRLLQPAWQLKRAVADRIVFPVAVAAGLLQGAAGISAPVSLTFLNAMKLTREVFIATVSILFLSMALTQIPSLWVLGVLTPERILLSLLACIPLFGGMPIGGWLARFIPRHVFDRIILGLLVVIGSRLMWAALMG